MSLQYLKKEWSYEVVLYADKRKSPLKVELLFLIDLAGHAQGTHVNLKNKSGMKLGT